LHNQQQWCKLVLVVGWLAPRGHQRMHDLDKHNIHSV
jgi:hypothetical protein